MNKRELNYQSISKNHKEVIQLFNEFNKIIAPHSIDCFYTGGVIYYIETNTPLSRLHSDIDLFINEKELNKLIDILKNNSNFKIYNNIKTKRAGGHELKILYKKFQVTIGLIIFERLNDQKIIKKEYYYDTKNNLIEECEIYSKNKVELEFIEKEKYYNKLPYKSLSLESIYLNKETQREKDIEDNKIIEKIINKEILTTLKSERIEKLSPQVTKNSNIIAIFKNN